MNRHSYQPNTLRIEGGRVLPALGDPGAPARWPRIVLLVHGFNNDASQARDRYGAFRSRLREVLGSDLGFVWELYWPGYEDVVAEPLRQRWRLLRSGNSLVTAARYYKQVPKAVESGRLLGAYLASLSPTQVILIGHSLGCRVIAEALSTMTGGDRGQVPGIYLMAGAVPVAMFEEAGPLKGAAEFPMHTVVLHSRRDTVLAGTFPGGQTLAGEGAFPEAVGLHGNPRSSWKMRDETMLRHGEYWSSPVTNPHIARVFGRTTRHELKGFAPIPRELAVVEGLPSWELLTHSLRTS